MLTNKYYRALVKEVKASVADLNDIQYLPYDETCGFREDVLEELVNGQLLRFFVVYRVGWEMDNFAAIGRTADGQLKLYFTNHGRMCQSDINVPIEEITEEDIRDMVI